MNELEGQMLAGRYKVIKFLGRGGMAEVYRVHDQERGVDLALKLLNPDLAQDTVFLRRFRREAETLSQLQHPNIVRYYGLEKDGLQAFILMDYIGGSTLRAEIAQSEGKSLPLERILEILRPVCSAIYYAHRKGFIHCDLKPANIMLESSGKVLVADFGIARMSEAATTTTLIGAGTPAYMSPEQVLGQELAPQTDIYALGIILFEMLTGGERPFTGENAQTTGSTTEKVRWEQLHLNPPSPRLYNPGISREMEAVVLRCLEKDPKNRYLSALDLINALQDAAGLQAAYTPVYTPPPYVTPSSSPIPDSSSTRGPALQDSRLNPRQAPAAKNKAFPIILVVIILITGGLILLLQSPPRGGQGPFVAIPPTDTPIPTVTMTATPEGQLYTNEYLGISLRYPAGWSFVEQKDGEYVYSVTFGATQNLDAMSNGMPNFPAFAMMRQALSAANLPAGVDLNSPESILSAFITGGGTSNYQTVGEVRKSQVSSYPAATGTYLVPDDTSGVKHEITATIIIAQNSIILFIGISPEVDFNSAQPVFDRVLASMEIRGMKITPTPYSVPVPAPTTAPAIPEAPIEAPTKAPAGPFEYTVQTNDTCWDIATRFNVDLSTLLELNNFAAGTCPIQLGQIILIPAPGPIVLTSVPTNLSDIAPGTILLYEVQPGDTLRGIALGFHSTMDSIMNLNPDLGDANNLMTGFILKISVNIETP